MAKIPQVRRSQATPWRLDTNEEIEVLFSQQIKKNPLHRRRRRLPWKVTIRTYLMALFNHMLAAILIAAMSATALRGDIKFVHRTGALSSPRRDLGAAAAGGKLFFGGGCTDTLNVYVCNEPSSTIDVINPTTGEIEGSAQLSEARGWPSTCAVGNLVVFAGGGSDTKAEHSTVADIVDASSSQLKVESNPTALSIGRWGMSCAATAHQAFFAGGKVSGSGKYYTTDVVDEFEASSKKWKAAGFKLSLGRESMGASAVNGSVVFAGGYSDSKADCDTVDTYFTPSTASVPVTAKIPSAAYWAGTVPFNNKVLIVDHTSISALVDGKITKSLPLPSELVRTPQPPPSKNTGGGIPGAHVPSNGVVVGSSACFYSYDPNALYCYNTQSGKWSSMPCSAKHQGGVIAAVGNTIAVAGGYDSAGNKPTAVIDFFDIQQ
jgi:hypothetical protein